MSNTRSVRIPDDGDVAESFAEEVAQRVTLEPGLGANPWTANVAGALATIALGGAVIIASVGYGLGELAHPGAGMFPLAIGVLFTVLGAVWAIQCCTRKVSHEPAEPSVRGTSLRVALSCAVIVAFALLVNLLGYQITMLLVMLVLLLVVGRVRWWLAMVLAAGMAFGSYTLFVLGLGVRLPLSDIDLLAGIGL